MVAILLAVAWLALAQHWKVQSIPSIETWRSRLCLALFKPNAGVLHITQVMENLKWELTVCACID